MKKSRFTEAKIMEILKQAEGGVPMPFAFTTAQNISAPRFRFGLRSVELS